MALTNVNIVQNDRGVYFEFTGDGATVIVPAIPFTHDKPRAIPTSITATLWTNATPARTNLPRTGLVGAGQAAGGVAVALASAVYSAAGVISITTSAAVANATVCYGEVSLDNYAE